MRGGVIDIIKGLEDIFLNKYWGVKILEYANCSNFSDWEISGILFRTSVIAKSEIKHPEAILETFLKKLPAFKGFTITKMVGDDMGFRVDFVANGDDVGLFEKFLTEKGNTYEYKR